jgi:eukaryotic-like serine/threonine-protein kinase
MPETTQFGGHEDEIYVDGALKPNTILLTRYKIIGILGGGGQGAVYQARDLNFPDAKRLVAIKEMHVQGSDEGQRASTVKTFQREANILATLSHPAIPKIYDLFVQNDRVYLVMEYINGSDLEALLTKTKTLPMKKMLEWAIDLCDVLHYLHSHQPETIIFRDMKPANVMIDSLGKVRLIDFGIAKVFVKDNSKKHTMIGTEGYSAPEQYKGNVTPLSDIYSLGATLHHVITRKDPRLEPPFSFSERPIEDLNEEVPPGLATVIEKALEFEPNTRYQSCAEMKEALEQMRYGPANSQRGATNIPMQGSATLGNNNVSGNQGTNWFDGIEDDLSTGIQAQWNFKAEDEIRTTPTAYRDMVFISSYDTNVWAINEEDGKGVWKFATTGGIAVAPVIDEEHGFVMVGSEDNTFYAIEFKNGRINWTYSTNGKIRSTARVAHGHVFFGSDDGKLYALVAQNGRYLWEYDMGAPVRTQPWVTNDMVICGCEEGELVALELSGEKKWSLRAKRAITSSPYVDLEGICYVGSFDGYLYAIQADSGYRMWRFRTGRPIVSSPVVDGNLVFFGVTDGIFYGVNTQTGKDKWRFSAGAPIVGGAIVHGESVYFGDSKGTFYCLGKNDGKEKWQFKTQSGITSAPLIAHDKIYITSMDKTVYALPLVGA